MVQWTIGPENRPTESIGNGLLSVFLRALRILRGEIKKFTTEDAEEHRGNGNGIIVTSFTNDGA